MFNSSVSYISEVEVMMHNRTIHIDEKMNLFVDGISTFYPLYYPSRDNAMVTVKRVFDQATIKNDDGVQVTFYVGYLCVRVPDVSEFRRKRTLCGLAGNMDGICRDDFIHRKGNEVDPGEGGFFDSCRFNGNRDASLNIAKAEDTWRTEEFLNYATTDACVDGWTMANITKHCNIADVGEVPADQGGAGWKGAVRSLPESRKRPDRRGLRELLIRSVPRRRRQVWRV
ncbi:hypothetical protein L596_005008 [Steinernema carpocapsae]|uniref:VWFD domain-containing protein n=1 Tax=Steinernema carpocapsae TaxID=34508 RepID=A0A4U8UXQ6_STECR|nr:hypothetical protein L596_005008 [Steinernema carpocapsae]